MLNVTPFPLRLAAAFVLVAGLLSFSASPSVVQADAGEGLNTAPARSVAGSLSGGSYHTCLAKNGNVYCWGFNNNFQLGDGTRTSRNSPQLVNGLTSPTSVSTGGTQSCAVQTDGNLLCWGNRAGYQSDPVAAPTKIQNASGPLTDVRFVDLGGHYQSDNGCAVNAAGALWCWGENDSGEVGDGTTTVRYNAVQVISSNVIAVSVGIFHSCAVLQSGEVKCWGYNGTGQLGIVGENYPYTPQSAGGLNAVGISVSGSHSCALISDGTVKCWGSNSNLQLGSGSADSSNPIPTAVTGLSGVIGVSAGDSHTCAVLGNGTVKCWGNNGGSGGGKYKGGRIGPDSVTPVLVSGIANATAVTAGVNHTCALIGTNDLKCWGDHTNGVLGAGNTDEPTATPVSVLARVRQTITKSSISAKTVNDTSISLSGVATSDSGVTVTYSNISGNEGVCNVSGTSVSILGAGRCQVQIDAAAYGFFLATTDTLEFSISGVAPTVATTDATSVGVSTATLNATVNARFISTAVNIEYGTSATLVGAATASGTAVTGSTDTARGVAVTGLAASTKYYFRASATNSAGSATASAIKSFTTLGGKPSATTAIASGVSANKATLNASVNANGLSTTVKYRVGKTANLSGEVTVYEGRTVTDFADESVPVSISSLSELVTYYYRVEVANSLGTATGEIKSFNTARPVGVTINSAAEFTNKKTVVLSVTGAAGSVSAIVSNDGGFGAAETFTLVDGSADINWTLISSRDERLPKQVYVKFVSRFGTQSANYQDDIILDTTAPVLSDATAVAATAPATAVSVASVRAAKKNGAKIVVKAVDANSGIGSIEMRSGASKKATSIKYANPKAKSQTLTVNTKAKSLQVRVIDRAGNPSPWKTVKVK